MKRNLKNYSEGLLFMFAVLLVFLLAFESHIAIPFWLNPLGRLHPLLLHFPLVLLLLLFLFDVFTPKTDPNLILLLQKYFSSLLLFSVLISLITAISGLILSQENGYSGDSLDWHKWTGSLMAILGCIYYFFRTKILNNAILCKLSAALLALILIITGHLGASLTHGENFVFESFDKKNHDNIAFNDAMVFEHLVMPIFESKCISCHGTKKMKGELLLNTIENIKKGGKTGYLIVAGNPEKSLLVERIFLDQEEKKHMPPTGKTQLTTDEKRIIKWWIQKNADFKLKVTSLHKNDSLSLLAKKLFSQNTKDEKYDFKSADAELIKKLNNEYRVINSKSKTSPALDVTLYNSAFYTLATLHELTEIKEQIVSLNVSKTPITDADLKTIGQFKNLKKLNLNFTKITGNGLQNLTTNTQLVSLSLAGISLNLNNLKLFLNKNKNVNSLSLWNTNLTENDLIKLKKGYPNIDFLKGGTENTLKLNLPFLKNKPIVFKDSIGLQIGHPINGVTIRFTTNNTDPDSLKSLIYVLGKTILTKTTTIKAKAFKIGWYGSDIAAFTVFKNSLKPDSVALLTKLNRVHPANGSATFFDNTFGTFNANSPAWANNWAGFRSNNMELLMVYKKPVTISEIALNLLIETETRIFPPQSIEIWGGTSEKNMKLLSITKPIQPKELSKPYILTIYCKTKPTKATFFKIVAKPMEFVPNWHPNKGKVPLFLVDELFVN